jgi:hypothetical protein
MLAGLEIVITISIVHHWGESIGKFLEATIPIGWWTDA